MILLPDSQIQQSLPELKKLHLKVAPLFTANQVASVVTAPSSLLRQNDSVTPTLTPHHQIKSQASLKRLKLTRLPIRSYLHPMDLLIAVSR